MGATESKEASAAWTVFSPKYHMVSVSSRVLSCLHVPEEALMAFELCDGDNFYMRDCIGRSFKLAVEKRGEHFVLGGGWSGMLSTIGCVCGDQLMMKFKAYRKCKLLVFCGTTGLQKIPASNGNNPIQIAEHFALSNSTAGKNEGKEVVEGSRKRPIDLDGPETTLAVYNASCKPLNSVMKGFISNISNTFDLKVPLYFCKICSISISTDFHAMSRDYGNTYLVPLFDRDGYPEVVNLVLNGDDEPYSVGFHVASDGTPVMSGGWANFLDTHFIDDGTELVFRFDFGAEDVIIHVYDF